MELDFEITVDQQTRARDRTFEGVPDSGCPRESHSHILSPILPNLDIRTKYDRFWHINWANINMVGKPTLLILYEYQLNTYLTVDSVVK